MTEKGPPVSECGRGDGYHKTKARKRLYCFETLPDLEDDQQSPYTPKQTFDDVKKISHVSNQCEGKLLSRQYLLEDVYNKTAQSAEQRETFSNWNQREHSFKLNRGDPGKLQTMAANRSHMKINQSRGEGKYLKGLLNEFTKGNGNRLLQTSPPFKVVEKITNRPTCTSLRESCTALSTENNEQEVPDIVFAEQDTNVDEDVDVLIISDDIVTSSGIDSDSDSDIDWNSLTPPAPRSPNDQRVPEMEHDASKSVGLSYNGYTTTIHRSGTEPLGPLHGFSLFEQPSYSVNFQMNSATTCDQVVPQISS